MKKENTYISTIASDGAAVARQYGLGLEIAEYCTAYNMDAHFAETDAVVQKKLEGIPKRILHAPFNELFPCAIDPKARELAKQRYVQAIRLAAHYGADKVVLHGGYNPWLYYPVWYVEQSILFWKDFLHELPKGITICLENVLEEEPGMLLDIVKAVEDPQLRLCLDVGHVNAYSKISVMDWLEAQASYISHFHIHNNDGSWDTHQPLMHGSIPMEEFLQKAELLCHNVTFTLEVMEADSSVHWLNFREGK